MIKFSREWAMPNRRTFDVPPIRRLVLRHLSGHSLDPFANECRLATVTNDIDPRFDTDFNMDALDFLRAQPDESADTVLLDPPYSPRQVSEVYRSLGRTVNMETTQASFWGDLRAEIARVVRLGGKVVSFGWNTNGVGKGNAYRVIEILLVPHGGAHNDTICVVEQREAVQLMMI